MTTAAVLAVGIAPGAPVAAATNSTLNFQARLRTDTGATVSDGDYNVEFKIYDVDTGGTALWTETYLDVDGDDQTTGDDHRLTVRNGYLTVNLGSRTSFPGTINWDQGLWITMNVGGTTADATPAWDGEMSPRLKLTGVPYAFRAGQLATGNGTLQSTLQLLQPTVGSQIYQIADRGAAGTYTLLTNDYVSTAAAGTTAVQIQGQASATAPVLALRGGATPGSGGDLLRLKDSSDATLAGFDSAGQLFLGRAGASGATGSLKLYNAANANTITIQSGTTVAGAGSGYTLTLPTAVGANGDCLKTSDANGTLTFGSCATAGGATSVDYSTSSNAEGGSIASSVLTLYAADETNPGLVSAGTQTFGGAKTFKVDSSDAFQVQDSGGSSLLSVDTIAGIVEVNGANFRVGGAVASTPTGVSVVAADNTGGTLSGASGTTYYYVISAVTEDGESAASTEIPFAATDFTPISAPGAPTVAVGANNGITGAYTYKITFVTANGETTGGTTSSTVNPVNDKVNLTNIPTGPTGTTARKIYRTAAGGADGTQKLVTTLNDNTTTSYTDSTDDVSLGADLPSTNTARLDTNQATVSWSAYEGALSYDVYRSTSTGGPYTYQNTASSPFTDTGTTGTSGTPLTGSVTGGRLVFTNPYGTNTIRLKAPGSNPAASYTLTLPSAVGGTGECLQTSDSTGTLVFGSCSTGGGVTTVGTFSGSSQANGASISGSTITFGPADDTNPGMVSTGAQTFAGAKTFEADAAITVDSTTAFRVQNAAGTTTVATIDTTNQTLTLRTKADAGTVGSELLSSSFTFADGSGWDGTGTGPAGETTPASAAHSTGTTAISPSIAPTISASTWYRVAFTVTGRTAGSVTPSMGGTTGKTVSSNSADAPNGVEVQVLLTANTTNLAFTPTTDFDGTIGNVSIMQLTNYSPTLTLLKSDGTTVGMEMRLGGTESMAMGLGSLQFNTTGINNTGYGAYSLRRNTTGQNNTALGGYTLVANTTGNYNTAVGYSALNGNTTGQFNTALGMQALSVSTTGYNNTALGTYALLDNTAGSENTAVGRGAIGDNTTGSLNVGVGLNSLQFNTTGSGNVALGNAAGGENITGSNNTSVGYYAGATDDDAFETPTNNSGSTALGYRSVVHGSNSVVLGGTGSNAVNVGIGTTLPDNTFSVAPTQYNGATANVTASQSTTTVTASSAVFTQAMVGSKIVWRTGASATITAVSSDGVTTATVTPSQTVTSDEFRVHYAGFQVTSTGKVGVGVIQPTANFQINTATNTTTAFQIQNASNNEVMTVDTTNGQLALGKASTLQGKLVFYGTAGANSVSLLGPSNNPASSFTMTLPSTIAGDGECLMAGTVSGGNVPLAFGSCGSGGSGATSVDYSTTPNAEGGSIAGSVLTLTAADGSNPGLLSATAQTIGGAKTFSSDTLVSGTSATAFRVQNASNNDILVADTSNAQVILGKASTLQGKLVFANSAGANTVSLLGPAADPTSSYTMTLPTAIAGSNQCLQSGTVSGGNVPLLFGSCSGSGGGATSVGAFVNSTSYAEGASISSGVLYMGSATATNPGLMSAGDQTFAGNKTFNGNIIQSGSATFTTGTGAIALNGDATIAAGKTLKLANSGNANLVSIASGTTSTSYTLTLPTIGVAGANCLKSTSGSTTTATALEWGSCGGGSPGVQRITLHPEFPGGTLTGDGTSNVGTMTSDFVRGLASGEGYKHNYYQWETSQATAQDYNINIQYQLPSDFSSFQSNTIKLWAYVSTTTSTDLTVKMYDADGTDCHPTPANVKPSAGGAWQQITVTTPGNGCTFAANDNISIVITPSSISTSSAKVRVGELQFDY